MRAATFETQARELAGVYLGSDASLVAQGLIPPSTIPDGTMLAVYRGVPPGSPTGGFQIFTAAPGNKSRINAGEVVPAGSTLVYPPSRSAVFGSGEDGRGVRGPWSIAFSLGTLVLPAESSGNLPKLVVPEFVRTRNGFLQMTDLAVVDLIPLAQKSTAKR